MSESKETKLVTIWSKLFNRKSGRINQSFGYMRDDDQDFLSGLSSMVREPNDDDDPATKRFLVAPIVFFESYQIELKR